MYKRWKLCKSAWVFKNHFSRPGLGWQKPGLYKNARKTLLVEPNRKIETPNSKLKVLKTLTKKAAVRAKNPTC